MVYRVQTERPIDHEGIERDCVNKKDLTITCWDQAVKNWELDPYTLFVMVFHELLGIKDLEVASIYYDDFENGYTFSSKIRPYVAKVEDYDFKYVESMPTYNKVARFTIINQTYPTAKISFYCSNTDCTLLRWKLFSNKHTSERIYRINKVRSGTISLYFFRKIMNKEHKVLKRETREYDGFSLVNQVTSESKRFAEEDYKVKSQLYRMLYAIALPGDAITLPFKALNKKARFRQHGKWLSISRQKALSHLEDSIVQKENLLKHKAFKRIYLALLKLTKLTTLIDIQMDLIDRFKFKINQNKCRFEMDNHDMFYVDDDYTRDPRHHYSKIHLPRFSYINQQGNWQLIDLHSYKTSILVGLLDTRESYHSTIGYYQQMLSPQNSENRKYWVDDELKKSKEKLARIDKIIKSFYIDAQLFLTKQATKIQEVIDQNLCE